MKVIAFVRYFWQADVIQPIASSVFILPTFSFKRKHIFRTVVIFNVNFVYF